VHGMGVRVAMGKRASDNKSNSGLDTPVASASKVPAPVVALPSHLPVHENVDDTPTKVTRHEPAGIDDDEPPIWAIDDLSDFL